MASQPAEHHPRITRTALAATAWTLFGVAFLFYVARLAVRWGGSHRFYLDDAWATCALLILMALAIVLQLAIPHMYDVLLVGAGLQEPSKTFPSSATEYLKMQFALSILFWSCLWAVKACFLAFFRRLTNGLKWCRRAWWAIVTLTALSYIGCIVSYPIACSSFEIGHCETPLNIYRSNVSLRYSTAVDMITDAMIIALPLYLAFRVRLPLSQRFALGGVFSLGIIIMIFAVIRIIVTNANKTHVDPSWLNLWSQIEASVAVIVSSLAPFKTFFTQRKLRSYEMSNSQRKQYGTESWCRSQRQRHSNIPPLSMPERRGNQIRMYEDGSIRVGSDDVDSMNRILVKKEIDVKTMV